MAKFKTHLLVMVSQKQIRDKRTYSVQAIMDATGLSRNAVNRWMEGSLNRIEPDTVLKLSKWLECDQSELFEAVSNDDSEHEVSTPAA